MRIYNGAKLSIIGLSDESAIGWHDVEATACKKVNFIF